MKYFKPIAWFLAVGCGLVAWYWLYIGGNTFLGGVATTDIDWKGLGVGYVATLFGVASGAAYRTMRSDPKWPGPIADFGELATSVLRSRDLWAGMIASPIVFGLIYRTVEGISLVGLVVVALENGFCCHELISRLHDGNNQRGKNQRGANRRAPNGHASDRSK